MNVGNLPILLSKTKKSNRKLKWQKSNNKSNIFVLLHKNHSNIFWIYTIIVISFHNMVQKKLTNQIENVTNLNININYRYISNVWHLLRKHQSTCVTLFNSLELCVDHESSSKKCSLFSFSLAENSSNSTDSADHLFNLFTFVKRIFTKRNHFGLTQVQSFINWDYI